MNRKIFNKVIGLLTAFSLTIPSMPILASNKELNIYLIRHGKTILNTLNNVQGWSDSPLTEEGKSVAEDLGAGLADVNFKAAYSSDRGRTIETAETILSYNKQSSNLKLTQLSDLRETFYGKYEGLSNNLMASDAAKSLGYASTEEFFKNYTIKEFVNAGALLDETGRFENYQELSTRLMRGLEQIVEQNTDGNILLVSHGNAIRTLLAEIGYDKVVEPKNSSVTLIKYKDGKFTVEDVNSMKYAEEGKKLRKSNSVTKITADKENTAAVPAKGKVEIYFVRHGKTIFNTDDKVQGYSDSPLTDDGVKGAVHAGIGLENIKFNYAFSSDLGRASQTADIILEQNKVTDKNITLQKLSGLRETNFGKYEGGYNKVMWTDIANSVGYATQAELFAHPDMTSLYKKGMDIVASKDETGTFETNDQVKKRVDDSVHYAIDKAVKNGGGRILVVAHGMIISDFLNELGAKLSNGVSNSSVSIVNYEDGKFTLVSTNDSSYIQAGQAKTPYQTMPSDYLSAVKHNDDKTVTIKDIVYYPIKAETEASGGKVYWEGRKNNIVTLKNGIKTTYTPGANKYYLNDEIKFMEKGHYTIIIDGVSYCPK